MSKKLEQHDEDEERGLVQDGIKVVIGGGLAAGGADAYKIGKQKLTGGKDKKR